MESRVSLLVIIFVVQLDPASLQSGVGCIYAVSQLGLLDEDWMTHFYFGKPNLKYVSEI